MIIYNYLDRCEQFLLLSGIAFNDLLHRLPTGIALCLSDLLCSQRSDGCNLIRPISSDAVFLSAPDAKERADLVRLRWNRDLRLEEVRRMLDSSKPVIIPLQHEVCLRLLSDA